MNRTHKRTSQDGQAGKAAFKLSNDIKQKMEMVKKYGLDYETNKAAAPTGPDSGNGSKLAEALNELKQLAAADKATQTTAKAISKAERALARVEAEGTRQAAKAARAAAQQADQAVRQMVETAKAAFPPDVAFPLERFLQKIDDFEQPDWDIFDDLHEFHLVKAAFEETTEALIHAVDAAHQAEETAKLAATPEARAAAEQAKKNVQQAEEAFIRALKAFGMEARSEAVSTAQMTQPAKKFWLVTYVTTDIRGGDYRDLEHHGVVEARDILAAEEAALREHVNEGFSEEEPFGPEDNEDGTWFAFRGLRAFEISDTHAEVDAGNVLWIENLREIDAADAQVLMKHLHRDLTPEQRKAEEAEQIRLRGFRLSARNQVNQ